MAEPTALVASNRRRPIFTRPAVVLPTALVLVIVSILLSPEQTPVDREGRLTTYAASPGAARGMYEVAQRLGWRVSRRVSPLTRPLDTAAVYAILDPPIPLSLDETHTMLDAVRRGAGLVYVVENGSPLSDSLRVRHSDSGYYAVRGPRDSAACPGRDSPAATMWYDQRVHLYAIQATAPLPSDTVVFLLLRRSPPGPRSDSSLSSSSATKRWPRYAAVGFPLGRGRVVAVADADAFRNDVVRVCRWGVGRQVVGMLDWVSGGGRPPLVFDEYHQGFGPHASVTRAMAHFLVRAPSGRTVAQIAAAGLVLLLALAVRPIVPRERSSIERRSPLEHVAALARAYEQIGASRVAARRLARGLRRRHTPGSWARITEGDGRTMDADAAFLSAVAARYPGAARDVARLRDAEERRVTAVELVAVAQGVERIDAAMTGRLAANQESNPVASTSSKV